MKNKRKRNSNRQFNILINGKSFKVLTCVISEDTNTLKIVTKVRGQKFPDSSCIDLQFPNSDYIYHLQILFTSMASSGILEEWIYTDKNFNWFIYFSHEDTVSFAGTIVPIIKKILQKEKKHWDHYEYSEL